MDLNEYHSCLAGLNFGKRVAFALYVFRSEDVSLGDRLNSLIDNLVRTYEISSEFNVIKFRTDDVRISFLEYPNFIQEAHPSLSSSIVINPVNHKMRRIDYRNNPNPPILHRKETMVPRDHPSREEFRQLTLAEEQAGLYEDTATIGFKLNWEKLLTSKGLIIESHLLKRIDNLEEYPDTTSEPDVCIQRHRTAMVRYDLSKPIKKLIENGLLTKETTLFDYGCGRGSDVEGLRALGYQVTGWDPVFRPNETQSEADIVNLGYVINVIEDSAERTESLLSAYRLSRRLLVVSAQVGRSGASEQSIAFRDGIITQRATFQKYFGQKELQQYIEDVLETMAIPVTIGIFYVFRSPAEQQDFLTTRSRRLIDWNGIADKLGLGCPADRRRSPIETIYEEHRELFDAYFRTMLEYGRPLIPEEFVSWSELKKLVGSIKRVEKLFIHRGGQEQLERAGSNRRCELLKWLSLSHLRKRIPWHYFSPSLQQDIRHFFGNHRLALEEGRVLLFSTGDSAQIKEACERTTLGRQDEQALHIHRSLLDRLEPLLQLYVACACLLFGDASQADLVKLHKTSGKVTFLTYDDFDNKAVPILQQRVKVNLRTQTIDVFDHSAENQELHDKALYLANGEKMKCT